MKRTKATTDVNAWRRVKLAPVTLLYGNNDYLAQRASEKLRAQFRQAHGEIERIEVSAKDYKRAELLTLTSPSLFGLAKLVYVTDLAQMSAAFLEDMLAYLNNFDTQNCLILRHSGGNRGKKLLDVLRAESGFNVLDCKEIKRDQDKLNFIRDEFAEHNKKIDPSAATLLLAAAGSDTAELAAACQQLIADGPDHITEDFTHRYYAGRIEVTAFKVSDQAVQGNSRAALQLLRQALDTSVEPIPLIGALASRMRTIARVHGRSGPARELAADLKLAPWQVEQAMRDSRRFSQDDFARIFKALAQADAQLKGEASYPAYAVEQAVLTISQAAGGR